MERVTKRRGQGSRGCGWLPAAIVRGVAEVEGIEGLLEVLALVLEAVHAGRGGARGGGLAGSYGGLHDTHTLLQCGAADLHLHLYRRDFGDDSGMTFVDARGDVDFDPFSEQVSVSIEWNHGNKAWSRR
eukprot:6000962-Pyramimonas_sp.AAC.1